MGRRFKPENGACHTNSGGLGRLGWLGPPVEVCPERELIAIEDPATVCDGAFEIGEGLEVLVRERLVEDGPQGLGRLQLGGVAGQGYEAGPIPADPARGSVPARIVEPEHEGALAAPPRFA